jgi:hypothetical protein
MKKKKVVNFDKRLMLRMSESEHAKIKEYAIENQTTISKLFRDFIKSITEK